MLLPRQLPEPAESAVLVGVLPVAALISFGALLVVNVGSFIIIPFAMCAEGAMNGAAALAARLAAFRRKLTVGAKAESEPTVGADEPV